MKNLVELGRVVLPTAALLAMIAGGGVATAQSTAGKFKYKTIAAVKCWMGSYDDNGNYTAGGCEGSTQRSAAPAAMPAQNVGSELVACVAGGGALMPVAGNDDALTCRPAAPGRRAGFAAPSEKAVAMALKLCLPKGSGVTGGAEGPVCTGA